jgi:hypothetical protein
MSTRQRKYAKNGAWAAAVGEPEAEVRVGRVVCAVRVPSEIITPEVLPVRRAP